MFWARARRERRHLHEQLRVLVIQARAGSQAAIDTLESSNSRAIWGPLQRKGRIDVTHAISQGRQVRERHAALERDTNALREQVARALATTDPDNRLEEMVRAHHDYKLTLTSYGHLTSNRELADIVGPSEEELQALAAEAIRACFARYLADAPCSPAAREQAQSLIWQSSARAQPGLYNRLHKYGELPYPDDWDQWVAVQVKTPEVGHFAPPYIQPGRGAARTQAVELLADLGSLGSEPADIAYLRDVKWLLAWASLVPAVRDEIGEHNLNRLTRQVVDWHKRHDQSGGPPV